MKDEVDISDVHWMIVWREAFGKIPTKIRYVIGGIMFYIQAIAGNYIVQNQSILINNPTYGVLAGSIFILLLSMLFMNAILAGKKELKRGNKNSVKNSDQKRKREITLKEADQIADIVENRLIQQSNQPVPQPAEKIAIRRKLSELEKRLDEIDTKSDGNNDLQEEVVDLHQELKEIKRETITNFEIEERISTVNSDIKTNRNYIRTIYKLMKENADDFEPPDGELDAEKSVEQSEIEGNTEQSTHSTNNKQQETEPNLNRELE